MKDNKASREMYGDLKKQITLNMHENRKSRTDSKAQQGSGSSVEMGLHEGLSHVDKKSKNQ